MLEEEEEKREAEPRWGLVLEEEEEKREERRRGGSSEGGTLWPWLWLWWEVWGQTLPSLFEVPNGVNQWRWGGLNLTPPEAPGYMLEGGTRQVECLVNS